MYKFLTSFVLAASLLMPVAMMAEDHHWDDHENAAWHQYLKEHKKKDHEWAKANKKEQADYWKWRDAHRDIH